MKVNENSSKNLTGLPSQLKRQNLPTGNQDRPRFAVLVDAFAKANQSKVPAEVNNLTPLTLEDYRNQAVPVRIKNTRSKFSTEMVYRKSKDNLRVPEEIQKVVDDTAHKFKLSTQLVTAIIKVESNFNPRAVSSEGARGLMQLMPTTAERLGVKNSFDIRQNINAGCRYLKGLIDRFEGNLELAVAAYNAGPGAVEKYGKIPPYKETQNYVKKVLAYC